MADDKMMLLQKVVISENAEDSFSEEFLKMLKI